MKKGQFENWINKLRVSIPLALRKDSQFGNKANQFSQEFVNNTIDFFSLLYKTKLVDESQLAKTMELAISQVSLIEFLPENERGLYGKFTDDKVHVNPELSLAKRKLYLFHEFAHVCMPHSRNVQPIDGAYDFSSHYGFQLIDEALAQNIAETLFWASENKPRPAKTIQTDRVLQGVEFATNFDYYGIYQHIAAAFGRTLRGIGTATKHDDDTILFDLSKKALKGDFLLSVIKEYREDGIENHLSQVLFVLGTVFVAKLKSFSGIELEQRKLDINKNIISNKKMNTNPAFVKEMYILGMKAMESDIDYRQSTEFE